ncbi:hypothetical protein D3C87_1394330 [compost metagenome]
MSFAASLMISPKPPILLMSRAFCRKRLSAGSRSPTIERAASVAPVFMANSCLLKTSAFSACALDTVPTSSVFSARSLRKGATSFTDLPNSSCTRRALLPSSAKPDSATATRRSASAGSMLFSSSALNPMAFNAIEGPFLPSASLSVALNFVIAPVTVSIDVPVIIATFSSALIFSMVDPVASATSLSASKPSMMLLP